MPIPLTLSFEVHVGLTLLEASHEQYETAVPCRLWQMVSTSYNLLSPCRYYSGLTFNYHQDRDTRIRLSHYHQSVVMRRPIQR